MSSQDQRSQPGNYANYFEVRYTPAEFIFDFGEYYPDAAPPMCHTRIVTNEESARAFCKLVGNALTRFEKEPPHGGEAK